MIQGKFVLLLSGGAEPLSDEEGHALQYILADALSDFRIVRLRDEKTLQPRTVEDYVRVRYTQNAPGCSTLYKDDDEGFNSKVRQVSARICLAERLHNAAIGVSVRQAKAGDKVQIDRDTAGHLVELLQALQYGLTSTQREWLETSLRDLATLQEEVETSIAGGQE